MPLFPVFFSNYINIMTSIFFKQIILLLVYSFAATETASHASGNTKGLERTRGAVGKWAMFLSRVSHRSYYFLSFFCSYI